VRQHAGDLSPAPPLPDLARDRLRIDPGLVAQVGGPPGEQFVKLSLGHALEDADKLGQQVSPADRELAEFGYRGGFLVLVQLMPSGVMPCR
jgi:hypothetical protein